MSIHLAESSKDLLLPTNDKIEVSLYPKLYSVELSTLVSEFEAFVLNKLPILFIK